jgi:hypothetical protein
VAKDPTEENAAAFGFWIGEERLGRATLDDGSCIHEHDPVGDLASVLREEWLT